ESSPFERALSTAEAVLYNADPRGLNVHINPNIRERQNGHGVERVSYRDIFIVSNPKELARWSRLGDDYKGPGKDAESENEFRKRVKRNVRRMQRAGKYEGRINVLFTHSENIGETIRQLGVSNKRYIETGSVTIVTAEPRTKWQRLTLRPRKLVVGDTIEFPQ
ncbi:MAG TPA: histidine phosphatase family protein, partial [Patescibacteria group bacterium]